MSKTFCISGYNLILLASALFGSDPLCHGVPADEIIPFPHEINCSLYYECYQGEKTLNMCPDDMWYSEIIQSCDFPESSGCKVFTTEPPYSTTNGDVRCEDGLTHYIPHPDDCAKYIECLNGNSYEMKCPPGLWFSDEHQMCVNPPDSNCGEFTTIHTTSTPWTTPHPVCWGVLPDEIKVIRVPGDCSKYYMCVGSELSIHSCPPGLYFNEDRHTCDFPQLVDCDDTTATTDPSPTTPGSSTTGSTTEHQNVPRCADGTLSYWPVPEECTKYIECYGGKEYLMNCPSGLYYSEEIEECVNPEDSSCGKTTTEPPSTTTRDPNWTPDPRCADYNEDRFLFPYPGDCTKYIECYRGDYNVFNCPSGLWFNPKLMVCDYPYEAGCEYGNIFLLTNY